MKNKQGLTIAALIVAIVGLSIGFAAFSNTLQISSSASVTPSSSNFKLEFANNYDVNDLDTGSVTASSVSTGVTAGTGTINNEAQGGPTLTGLSAAFTAPGQSVTYSLYVVNTGKYIAYLRDLVMGNITCEAIDQVNDEEEATSSLVTAACRGMSVSATIGQTTLNASGSLNNEAIAVNGHVSASITISYASGSAYVDGPMRVNIGDITFTASSVAGEVATPVAPTYSVGDTYTGDFISTTAGVITGYQGNLTSITIPDALPVVEVASTALSISKCLAIYDSPDSQNWCEEAEKYYNEEENTFTSEDIEMYNQMIDYMTTSTYTVTNVTPQTITSIGDMSFVSKGLENVTFTNNITSIGMGAFASNSLTTLDMPSSIINIDDYAFSDNRGLTITIHNNQEDVILGEEPFDAGTILIYDDTTVTVSNG